MWKKWFLPHGVLRKMAEPFVALSMGNITCVMVSSGMKAASSQIMWSAVYPRSRFSLQGNATISELLCRWISVLVCLATPWRSMKLFSISSWIRSSMMMLCLRLGEATSTVVFGFVYA